MPTILVVDDEANIRRMLVRLLESEGYRAQEAADAGGALSVVEEEEPDVVLLDLVLPGAEGLDLLERLRERAPRIPVVMMSGRASLSDAVRATKLGAFHFIEKPLAPEAVLLTIGGAVEVLRARELSRLFADKLGGQELVGSSPAMQAVRELIARVAPTDARVLITGESGTGKELAAGALHAMSGRAAGPFIGVNSAALPRDLVESELFGHERGAFTGAAERRRGRFELADGGTLFLDEVADLGAGAQAKLLRVLESGEVERLGARSPIKVDVRVVAATNRDLAREMAAGAFRGDLFYRLNVVPIRIPPLRDRLDDVPELAAYLFGRLRARQGLEPPLPKAAALERMRAYRWPGNVRELANICERLAILHPGEEIDGADVAAVLDGPATPVSDGPDASALRERLDAFERELLQDALQRAGGNVAAAARELGTDRSNMYRRMRRLGIGGDQ